MTLTKETEDSTNIWKDIVCSWIRRINIAKMTILPKEIYRFNAIPIKLPRVFFTEIEQVIFKCMETQKTPDGPNNLEKEQNCRNQTDFRLYYKATVSK